MPNVHCTVNTCTYWQSGNFCNADNIVIQNNQNGGFPPNAQLSNLSATPASTIDDTCCQTFKNSKK